jgi:hypothetical protein
MTQESTGHARDDAQNNDITERPAEAGNMSVGRAARCRKELEVQGGM